MGRWPRLALPWAFGSAAPDVPDKLTELEVAYTEVRGVRTESAGGRLNGPKSIPCGSVE